MTRIGNFLKYNKHKKLTLAVYFLTAFYRAQVLMVSSKKLEKKWGERGAESAETDTRENYWQAYRISKEVTRVADKTPWESKCLVQALTAQYLLRRKGIKSTLYLGVGKEEETQKMIAHAWIRVGEHFVTGGDGSKTYAVVAKFVK